MDRNERFSFETERIAAGWYVVQVAVNFDNGTQRHIGSYGIHQGSTPERVIGRIPDKRHQPTPAVTMRVSADPETGGLQTEDQYAMAAQLLILSQANWRQSIYALEAALTDQRHQLETTTPIATENDVLAFGEYVSCKTETTTWGQLADGDQIITEVVESSVIAGVTVKGRPIGAGEVAAVYNLELVTDGNGDKFMTGTFDSDDGSDRQRVGANRPFRWRVEADRPVRWVTEIVYPL